MSTVKVDTIKTTGNVEVYTYKAWVNFNGTGTVAIRGSGNVSSITDAATGVYIVNFTNAMPDTNYAVSFGAKENVNGANLFGRLSSGMNTTDLRTVFADESGTASDGHTCNVIVFR